MSHARQCRPAFRTKLSLTPLKTIQSHFPEGIVREGHSIVEDKALSDPVPAPLTRSLEIIRPHNVHYSSHGKPDEIGREHDVLQLCDGRQPFVPSRGHLLGMSRWLGKIDPTRSAEETAIHGAREASACAAHEACTNPH